MMMFADMVNVGMSRIATRLGNQVFTWKGEDYECIPSTANEIRGLEEGGFSVDADLSLSIRRELFTDGILPAAQQKISYRGRGYRIITIKQDASTSMIRLICEDDSRGI